MLPILPVLILVWHFYIGYSRGIILQTYYSITSIVSLTIVSQFYQTLAEKVTLWIPYSNANQGATVSFFMDVNIFDLDQVCYAGAAFTAIYVVVYLLSRFIGILVHLAPINHFDNVKMNCADGVLVILATLIFSNLVFAILATVPMTTVQDILSGSFLARVIVDGLLPLSNIIKALQVTVILG